MHISKKYQIILISALLITLILAAFEPIRHNAFVNYDDDKYITQNPYIQSGITFESVTWAFTTGYYSYWHPLTWLSHMLDIELFGHNPLGHHLHNLALHIIGTILLFWVLQSMTGAVWRSAFVAIAFGVHPLHVESVAWAAERKDILCFVFWMLTMAAYLYYARRGGILRYLLVILCFVLGLMSKPMIVSLPLVLLLLDFWPLRRVRNFSDICPAAEGVEACRAVSIFRLILEKTPLFLLAIGSGISTYLITQITSMIPLDSLPLSSRIANALVSGMTYLSKTFWPVNMAVFYPYPRDGWPGWMIAISFLVLAMLAVLAVWQARKRSYLFTGWFWFGITLIPVIGLVQVSWQSMADRYMYLPSIGVFIMISWAAADLSAKWRRRGIILGATGAILAVAMIAGTRTQLGYWKDSMALCDRALAVTRDNYNMYYNKGMIFYEQGKEDEAFELFTRALQIHPGYYDANNNIACIFMASKQYDRAMEHLQKALQGNPVGASAYYNLGNVYEAQGKMAEALQAYEQSIQLKINDFRPFYRAGFLKVQQGLLNEAEDYIRQSIQLNPAIETYQYLALILQQQERYPEAIALYQSILQKKPNDYQVWNNLADCLGAEGKIQEAIEAYRQVLKCKPDEASAYYYIGELLEILGMPDDALASYEQAIRIKPDDFQSYCNAGILKAKQGLLAEAEKYFRQSIQLNPNVETYQNLGLVLLQQQRIADAIEPYQFVVQKDPNDSKAWSNLGYCFQEQNKPAEAIHSYNQALKLDSSMLYPLKGIAWILSTTSDEKLRNPSMAIQLAQKACQMTNDNDPDAQDTLAAAYAAAGQFKEAVETAQKAILLADSMGQKDKAGDINKRLQLYQASKSYIEPPRK